jgi:hypothetical protein
MALEPPLDIDPEKIIRGSEEPTKDAAKHVDGKDKMTDEEFQSLVFTEVTDAVQYIQEDGIMLQRWAATDYYKGRLPDVDVDDDDEEDRSRAVMTEVRDTWLGIAPDLLRIFFSSSQGVVKYDPVAHPDPQVFAANKEAADIATAYVQDTVLQVDNPDHFRIFHDWFQDAWVRKTGIIKYWWEKTKRPVYTSYSGLDEPTLMALAADDDTEIVNKRVYPAPQPQLMAGTAPGTPSVLYDVTLKRVTDQGKVKIRGIPCENIFVSRMGRSMNDTPLFGYSEEWTLGDFVAEGYDADELADCDEDIQDTDNPETQARQPNPGIFKREGDNPAVDPTQRKIKYTEAYLIADYDNDGIPELRKAICAGTRFKVLENEPADDIPFADLCPYLEAFVFFGDSGADLTMDVQRIKTRVLRDVLDSLAQTVTPQTAVVEGQVNLDDVLNPDRSKVVRMRAPGMVQPMTTPFVGKEGLPILELMTQVKEQRTGQSEASQGLDAGVLQSSTASAVSATLTKAQSRTEMVARVFAETGMRKLFTGILKLLVKHQTTVRTVFLRGKVVQIDPSQWSPEMSVTPTVALGRGTPQEQLAFLAQVLGKQEMIIMQYGPDNPICGLEEYYFTLSRLVELGGWRNVGSFFKDPGQMTPQQKQQFAQQMQQAAQAKQKQGGGGQDPQVQMAKIQSDQKIAQGEQQLRMQEMQMRGKLDAAKMAGELHLKMMEMQMDRGTIMDKAHLDGAYKMMVERLNAATELQIEDKRQESARIEARAASANDG